MLNSDTCKPFTAWKQMIDVTLLLSHNNAWNNLTVWNKWLIVNRKFYVR